MVETAMNLPPGAAKIGADCVVGESVVLGAGCILEDHVILAGSINAAGNVVFGGGCYARGPLKIGHRVSIGPLAAIDGREGAEIEIGDEVSIGANATICAGLTIGSHAVVEAGAVVRKNVPAAAVVAGNPAKILGYASATASPMTVHETAGAVTGKTATGVRGVTLHRLPLIEDLRGNLSVGETLRDVPFEVRRYFLTFDVSTEEARGEHAHRTLRQFLICVSGRLRIMVDDGERREEFVLDRPNLALYLPPMVWGVQYGFSPGAVLLVLCSDHYDPADYIRDYPEFLALSRARNAGSNG